MRFIFFTKTDWVEPPRLRHQLARLLADAGHEVIFFQKPMFPWQKKPLDSVEHCHVHLMRYRQLLHHKLRISDLMHFINAGFESREIHRATRSLKIKSDDVIVNFNYEYYFLRQLFKTNQLITIINDNFWSSALWGYERPLKKALERTCITSNSVLTVSPPLQRQLSPFCMPRLFLPWSDIPYSFPAKDYVRDTLLFWGYINNKTDFNFIRRLADEISLHNFKLRILLVGPVQKDVSKLLELMETHPIVETLPPSSLDALPLHRVLAGLVPYRSGVPAINSITLPNKALQLLARGLPLMVTGMPEFITEPFVYRLGNAPAQDVQTIIELQRCFLDLQPDIERFVSEQTAKA